MSRNGDIVALAEGRRWGARRRAGCHRLHHRCCPAIIIAAIMSLRLLLLWLCLWSGLWLGLGFKKTLGKSTLWSACDVRSIGSPYVRIAFFLKTRFGFTVVFFCGTPAGLVHHRVMGEFKQQRFGFFFSLGPPRGNTPTSNRRGKKREN